MDAAIQRHAALAKHVKGRAAVQCAMDALKDPNLFVFGELLDLLAFLKDDAETADLYRTLHCFAYGTWAEYQERIDVVKDLPEEAMRKLRLLTLVAECEQNPSPSYQQLMISAGLSSVKDLEKMLMEAIAKQLIQATLSQTQQVVYVDGVMGRDVLSASILQQRVHAMKRHCDEQLQQLDLALHQLKEQHKLKKQNEETYLQTMLPLAQSRKCTVTELEHKLRSGPHSSSGSKKRP